MIVLTVGNATQNSRRLLGEFDRLACEGVFGMEDLLVQYGNNPEFQSRRCICTAFLSAEEFGVAMEKADVVICHAGAGTLLHALGCGKIPVVVPRRLQYGELIDDHQVQLAAALASNRRIVSVMDVADLGSAISQARALRTSRHRAEKTRLAAVVTAAIHDLVFK
jgi:beta-1,4-N-acetylglucosaminyltransferase